EEQSYYPVACFAALEVDFRWEIRNLVDSGDTRFIKNVRVDELQIIIDHDLLIASHGKRVTIGELIAHSVSFSNLDAINRTMGQLLRADFLDLVKNARDSEERRAQGENAPLILPSISDTLAKVSKSADERLSPKLSPKSSNFA